MKRYEANLKTVYVPNKKTAPKTLFLFIVLTLTVPASAYKTVCHQKQFKFGDTNGPIKVMMFGSEVSSTEIGGLVGSGRSV